VALLGFETVQHVPFPSLRQARSLEPDGIAVFANEETGDGSGGNVLITIRATSSEFLYVLQNFTLRVNTSAGQPGPVVCILNPEWIQDLQLSAEPYDIESSIILREGTSTVWRADSTHQDSFVRLCRTMPTGKIANLAQLATTNLMLFNYTTNTNLATYETVGTFYMYRREALTVPGFLEALVRPALIR